MAQQKQKNIKQKRSAKEAEIDSPTSYNHWLQLKETLIQTLLIKKGVYNVSKKFNMTLMAAGESEEFEEERRAYGLAPPLALKVLKTDSEEIRTAKNNLYTCVMGIYCCTPTNRDRNPSFVPPVLVALGPEDDWKTLNKVGIYRHEIGSQFLCVSHLRTPDKIDNPKAKSAIILKHWLLHKTIWPGALIFLNSNHPYSNMVWDHVRAMERTWFKILGHPGPSTLPLDEDLEMLP